ncbi:MAG: hypothetical protein M1814_002045, partial [Vezdaea aestivalis]
YNGGSDNAVTFSLKNPSGRSKVRPSKDVCEDKFLNVVIAGCDGNNPDNPFNVKYGGTYTDVNGWEYTMTPTAHRTPDNNCQFQWAAVLDIIDIRGKNWPQSQLQTNGEGLNRALGKCGVVKKWNFEATPDDTVYQWHASFTLGVWQKPCVVNAIKTAGGLTNTNCKGSS